MGNLLHKLALAAALAFFCVAEAQENSKSLPISLDADSSSIDRQTNLIHFRGLRITQGGLRIEADEALATGLDFEQSEWRFTGGVRIVVDSAVLESDRAVFTFSAHQLATAELEGNPASFTDQSPDREEPARGSANKLSYDYAKRILRMSDNARLSKGPNEIKGCDLIYDFAEERVTSGSSDCGEPFRITILPPPEGTGTDSAPNP